MFEVSVHGEGKQDPMVHRTDCFFYTNRQGDAHQWYGPYTRFTDAWKICFQQAQAQNRIPQRHIGLDAM